MLTRFESLLLGARAEGQAVAALTAYDLESAVGILRAAGVRRRIILLVPGRLLREDADGVVLAALRAAAAHSAARVCLQADHVHDLETVERACRFGAGAVMADGSQLPFEENVAFVRAARRIALRHGAGIEGEIGRLAGSADGDAPVGPGALTEPGEAAEFAALTGVDCLAVAVGNVHGMLFDTPATLDERRLLAIRDRVRAPLALHGASGLDTALLRGAVRAGITKINVNTALRRAYLEATRAAIAEPDPLADVVALHDRQATAVEHAARAALDATAVARVRP